MAPHYRKDNPNGITAPNPDSEKNIVSHITKHRGMKTPYTSVSEDEQSIRHFSGALYRTDSDDILKDKHQFIPHSDLLNELQKIAISSARTEKILAQRAYQMAARAKEAIVDWGFSLDGVERKDRVTWCFHNIQKYFQKV